MKIQDIIPAIHPATKLAICTSMNMLFFGTKEDLLSDTNSNVYLVVCNLDVNEICVESNSLKIEV